ncbi:DUF2690 domain-containing protein [Ktedonobacter sp. SOSP1-52]|uniref:DUF2690 domain-containing protein n=1 Tax=Ktedonobacter sp. SOSP1-52 TaxID=2778366 RepID=UPI001916A02A|nr:DUF2690 domain-containing protein [Ktedonobacter sp. SOSP1-52]
MKYVESKGKRMLTLKRFMLLGLMLAMLSTLFVFTTKAGVASAHTTTTAHAAASCYNTSCDGKSPLSGCDIDAVTKHTATSGDLGGGLKATVSLRYSVACGSAWAQVVFNKPLTSPHGGNATIKRNNDGKSYSCASANGNGLVAVTQTSCFSAMVGDAYSNTAFASAQYYTGSFHTVATTASY